MLDVIENELDEEDVVGGRSGKLVGNEIVWISVEEIMPNRSQPRKIFNKEGVEELAKSIEEYGVLQPIAK